MKLNKNIILMLAAAIFAASCDNDGEKITTTFSAVTAGSTSENSVVLTPSTSSDLALSLYWTDNGKISLSDTSYKAPDYAVTNVIQFSASEDFSGKMKEITPDGGIYAYQLTVYELNSLVLNLGFEGSVSTPLYIRIKSVLGNNLDPGYSNVMTINVTPYVIDMSKLSMRNKDTDQTVFAHLTSAQQNGEYEGFAVTSGTWQNFYFVENDGTVWGNDGVAGTPFLLSSESTMWSCWFPDTKGCHYVYMSNSKKEWSTIYIPTMTAKVNGADVSMTFDATDHLWGVVITTTSDNAAVNVSDIGKLYDINTGTDDASAVDTPFSIGFSADGAINFAKGTSATGLTIPAAGKYTLFLYLDSDTYELKTGEQSIGGGESGGNEDWPTDNAYAMPSSSKVYITDNTDLTNVKASLYSASMDGIYTGFYNAAAWENFMFTDASDGSGKVYGSAPVSDTGLYRLYCSSDKWNIWFDAGGYFYIKADFTDSARSWSKTEITSIAVTGDFNSWSLTSDVMTYDSTTKLWTVNCNPSSWGTYGIKFIINGDWNWGYSDSNGDGILEAGTTEFLPSAAAGSCTITLDLNDPSKLSYSIKAN